MADRNKGPRRRRTWPQRLLILFNVMCMAGALTTAGVLGYSNKQIASVTRVSLKSHLRSEAATPPGAPLNYLLVGADDDAGLADTDPVRIGRGAFAGAFRTDTIMILRIDPKDATARILSFPRDLWVTIPGRKYKAKINSAVERSSNGGGGGASGLIETIKADFDIPIDHYIQVNFAGFKQLVNAIGGVPIFFQYPTRVRRSTAFVVPDAGCHTLDGDEALAFTRARKDYQIFRDGRWRTDLRGDFGRIDRQQFFIQAVLARAFEKGIRDPNTLRKLVDLGVKSVIFDDQLKTEDALTLGNRFRNFVPSTLQKYTVPATQAFHGAADAQDIDEAAAEPIFDLFRGVTATTGTAGPGIGTTAVTPVEVTVQVLNGGQPGGTARSVTDDLTDLGFHTAAANDAKDPFAGTTVLFAPGHLAQAQYLARFVSGAVALRESDAVKDTGDADVVLVVGPDWAGTRTSPKPADQVPTPETTVTTAPPSTTTTTTSTSVPETTTTAGPDPFIPLTPAGKSCG